MAEAVARTLRDGGHLLVEAGTGTGKTLAYLTAALLSGGRVVISTATKALQEQVFHKDLPVAASLAAEVGVSRRVVLMKGVSNYLCRRRLAQAEGEGGPDSAALVRIARWAESSETGDRQELDWLEEGAPLWSRVESTPETRVGAGCPYYERCFVTAMRRAADDADVLVVNHHLFFADLALRAGRARGQGGVLPAYDAVILDEAHQVESIATEFFGSRVSSRRCEVLLRDAERALARAKGSAADAARGSLVDARGAAEELFGALRAHAATRPAAGDDARRSLARDDLDGPLAGGVDRLDAALADVGERVSLADAGEEVGVIARRCNELRAALERVAHAARSASSEAEDSGLMPDAIAWIDVSERAVSLASSPVEVGGLLREHLFDATRSVVCTSATLSTTDREGRPGFHYVRARMGAPPDAVELAVPSPFDYASHAALYVPSDLPDPTTPGAQARIADRIAELIEITGGGAFVLCTSTRAMRAYHAALRGRVGPLWVQGDAPKGAILDAFRKSGHGVLVATMSFWEGIDVPGEALRLVILDKIPFAVPTDPVVQARSRAIERSGGSAFSQYAVPQAALTLKQGFGRLIRSQRDSGVVALLDSRARTKGYGRLLLRSLSAPQRLDTLDDVRAFWAVRRPADAAGAVF